MIRPSACARSLTAALLATTALSPPASAQNLPTGYSTAYGSVGFQRSSALTINQSSQNAIVNFNSFSIGRHNQVDIRQPNVSSTILDRVTGAAPSTIAGRLNANGQVYLINPNGIAITRSGVVKVGGGFVGSTLDMTDDEFLHARKHLAGKGGSAAVTNAGTITIGRGGYADLIGGTVTNSGLISVPLGKVGLGSGEAATLDVSGDGFLQVAVPTAAGGKGALIQQSGTISAAGGTVVLDAATARAAARAAVNISGDIDAHTISGHSGAILIGGGDGGAVDVAGTLDVGSRRTKGGAVTITGQTIALSGARIKAAGRTGGGTVKIGGDLHGGGTLPHAGTVTVDAKSVITADATSKGNGGSVVVWSDETTSFSGLISAKGGAQGGDGGNVEVSSHGVLSYTGLATLTAAKGAAGTLLLDPYNVTISNGADSNQSGLTAIGNDSVISVTTLQNALRYASVTVSTGSSGSQAGNITVAASVTWSSSSLLTLMAANAIAINAGISITGGGKLALNSATAGSTIQPMLSFGSGGSVTFASGQTGQALTINGASYKLEYSLASLASDANATSSGTYALVTSVDGSNGGSGYSASPITRFSGTIEGLGNTVNNLTISASVTNTGLIGQNSGTIRDIGIAGGSVNSSATNVGGLVGTNASGTIIQAYATDTVTGVAKVGGLAGVNNGGGTITQSYATGTVTGSGNTADSIGGLVGGNNSTITQSYATGAVNGGSSAIYLGGLVGYSNTNAASIMDSYATGAVSGGNSSTYLGGLVGYNTAGITQSYAAGTVNGMAKVGGLVGYNAGSVSQSYATGRVVGGAYSFGGLVGYNSGGTVTASYYDTQTTGQSTDNGGATGVTTAGLANATTLGALNSAGTVWGNAGNKTTPYLINNIGPVFLATDTANAPTAPTYYTPILTQAGLVGVNTNNSANYVLAANLDLGGTTYVAAPITSFSGTFEGLGHTISNLTITGSSSYAGLIGTLNSTGILRDIGVVGGSVSGTVYVGGLVGFSSGTITQAYATSAVGGSSYVGGLVGDESGGALSQVYATGAVSGAYSVGGLVGNNSYGSIKQAYATGAVTGGGSAQFVGGLVGSNNYGALSQVYTTGAVSVSSGSQSVGGLVGQNYSGTIAQAYYDTLTVGPSTLPTIGKDIKSQGSNVVGYTTRQLQGLDPLSSGTITDSNHLGTTFAGGTGGLYPYLSSLFPNGVQVISGFAYTNAGTTAASGATIGVIAGGKSFGTASAGANGYYYAFAPAGTTPNDASGASTLLAYGTSPNSATVTSVAGTAVSGAGSSTLQSGVNLYGNTLAGTVGDTLLSTASTSLVTNANAAANGNAGVLAVIAGTTGRDYIATGSSFTIDQAVSTSGVFGVQTTTANAPITVAAGDAITIGSGGGLILNAAGALTINAPVTAKGNVAVNLAYDQNATTPSPTDFGFGQGIALTYLSSVGQTLSSSAGGTLAINGTPYTLEYSLASLVSDANATAGNYALATNVDGSNGGTPYASAPITPTYANGIFDGTIEGLGHTVSNPTIAGGSNVGLVGFLGSGSTLRDIGIVGGSVSGKTSVGALAGQSQGIIVDAYASTNVSGVQSVGGLVGGNNQGSIIQSYATGVVTSAGNDNGGVGGLVGSNNGMITLSYATGFVTSDSNGQTVGGLVGGNSSNGMITQSYATGAVSGPDYIGGLAGFNYGTITQTYATGAVISQGANVGGLVGSNLGSGSVTYSAYDSSTAGTVPGIGNDRYSTSVTALTTAQLQMQNPATTNPFGSGSGFAGGVAGGQDGVYPYLSSFFPKGVQAISGFAYSDAGVTPAASNANGPVSVGVIANGTSFGTATTGANGYYYVFAPAGTVTSGTNNLLAYSTTPNAATVTSATGGTTQAGVTLYGNAVTEMTSLTSLSALGGVSGVRSAALAADDPAHDASAAINGAAGLGIIASNTTGFTVDTPVTTSGTFLVQTTASGASITIASNAPVMIGNGGSLGLYAAGALTIDAPITAQGTVPVALAYDGNTTTPSPTDLSFGLTASGFTSSLTFESASGGSLAGTTGAGGTLSVNGQAYTLIYSMAELDAIDGTSATGGVNPATYGPGLAGSYALAANLDASGTAYTDALVAQGQNGTNPGFSGTFEGLGHVISGLTINQATTGSEPKFSNLTGLFGQVNTGGAVRDLGLTGGSVVGVEDVGGLVGLNSGALTQVYATGTVSGFSSVGDLVGYNYQGSITNAYATGGVTETSIPSYDGGGLGGLVGQSSDGTITNAYAAGSVVGAATSAGIGGLVGSSSNDVITNAYATGAVISGTNSRALGGLVGSDGGTLTITNAYATGAVSGGAGSTDLGGLIGGSYGSATISNTYYDSQTTGQSDTNVAGLTTRQLQGLDPLADGSTFSVVSNLGNGTTSAFAGGANRLYPYLSSFFPNGQQAVSGTVYNDGGATPATGATVAVIAGGQSLGNASAGANGYFYVVAPGANAISSGANLLVYTNANAATGATNAVALGTTTGVANQQGIIIYGNAVTAPTNATSLTSYLGGNTFAQAQQAARVAAINAEGSSTAATSAINGTSGLGLITSGSGFTLDAPLPTNTTFVVQTDAGNPITVAAGNPITLGSGGSLGLLSGGALTVNAPITAQGSATVALGYDASDPTNLLFAQAPLTFTNADGTAATQRVPGQALAINGQAYTLLYSMTDVSNVNANLAGNYALAGNIDASASTYTAGVIAGGDGSYNPPSTAFSGTLEGLGHAITSLTINSGDNFVGLVGYSTGTVRDIGLVGGSVTGGEYVGGLVGYNEGAGGVINAYAAATVSGANVGGLVGYNSGAVTQVYATGDVSVNGGNGGGLVGEDAGTITNAYAAGSVTNAGASTIGGLVGRLDSNGTITDAYATGAVIGGASVFEGGLVGASGGAVTSGFYDSQTTGQSDSNGGTTGLTTRQLQGLDAIPSLGRTFSVESDLGDGTSSAFAGGTGGLYPYLSSFFPKGVQAISGTAYTDAGVTPAAGATVGLIAGGQSFASASAGANGYFYAFAPAGTVANDVGGAATLLAYGTTMNAAVLTGVNGMTVAGDAHSTLQTGVTLYGNAVTVPTSAASLSGLGGFAATLSTARQILEGVDDPAHDASFAISHAQGLGLIVSSAFAVDAPVTTSGTFLVQTPTGARLNVTAPITIASGGALGLLSGGPLAVDAPVTVKGAVSVNLAYDASSPTNLAFAQGAPLTYTDASGNPLTAAPAAGAGSLTVNKQPYTLLYSLADVAGIDANYTAGGDSGNYALATNLTGSGTAAAPQFTSSLIAAGDSFGGTFEGLGHTITNLTIASNERYVGLVSNNDGLVRDIGLVGGSVSGVATGDTPVYVGALAGLNTGTIAQAYATTIVSATANAGNNFNSATAGGLVGYNSGGAITNAYATGPVSASADGSGATAIAGGLVGYNDAYFTGGQGTISNSYAAGAVYASAPFSSSSGSVAFAGGLVGTLDGSSGTVKITNAYATGAVSASNANTAGTGGLVGDNINGGFVTAGYYDTNTTGQTGDAAGATGLTTVQLQMQGGGANLGTAFGGGANGLYPYLNSFFPNGVQAISGTAYVNGGVAQAASYANNPITVGLIANGASFGSATTGANGYYYAFAPAGTAAAGSLLAYSTTTNSATLTSIGAPAVTYSGGGTVQTGVNLYGNAVTVPTGETSLQSYIMNGGSVAAAQALAEAADDPARDAQSTIQAATGLGLAVHNAFTIDAPLPTPANSTFVVQTDAGQSLTVAAPITIVAGGSLGLFSGGTLNVNAPITAEGTASVALGFDASNQTNLAFAQGDALTYTDASGKALTAVPVLGTGGQLFINGQFYSLVYNMADVANITNGLDGRYALAGSLYATSDGTATGTPIIYASAPIASGNTPFSGTLEGLGHTITNLTINDTTDSDVGLIASNSGTVRDIGLVGGSVIGQSTVGDLVGHNDGGTITQAYATGAVSGQYNVGGLVGYNDGGTITRAYATGAVSGSSTLGGVGGLVGYNDSGSTITQAYATGAVSGSFRVGGLVGANYSQITQSYATGAVGVVPSQTASSPEIGGLVGYNDGTVTASAYDKATTGQTYGIGYNENGAQPGNSGATPLTTAQLQDGSSAAGLGSAFTVTSGLYPYLTSFFPNGVQAVSGIAYSDNGQTPLASPATSNGLPATQGPGFVSVAAGGTTLGTVTTGANGYYYFALPASALPSNTTIVASTQADPNATTTPNGSGAQSAATYVTVGSAANQAGTNVYGGWQYDTTAATMLSALNSADAGAASAQTPAGLANRQIVATGSSFALDAAATQAGTLVLDTAGSVTQSATINAGNLLLEGGGSFTLKGANTFGTLAGTTATANLATAGATSVGTLSDATGASTAGLSGTNGVTLVSGSNQTLNAAVESGAGTVLLVADGSFTNNAGASGVSAANGFTICTQDATNPTTTLPKNVFGGLAGTSYYDDAYTFSSGSFASAIPQGNHFAYAYAASLTPVLGGSASKTYDGTTTAPTMGLNLASTVFANANGIADSTTLTFTGATFADMNAGTGVTVTANGIAFGSNPNNYTLTSNTAVAAFGTITQRPLDGSTTIGGLDKTYDRTAAAPGGSTVLTGTNNVVAGDTVDVIATSGTYASPSAGHQAVTLAGLTLDNANYAFGTLTVAGSGTIAQAPLTIKATDQAKTYGQTASLGTTAFGDMGLVSGDSISGVTLTSAGATAKANVGGYAISASNATGSGLSNYAITYDPGSLTVNPLAVQLTGTAVYNGTTNVAGASLAVSNLVNSDSVSVGGTGTMASKDVGSEMLTSLAGLTLSSTNYTLVGGAGAVTVTPATLTYVVNPASRTYGTANPALSGSVTGFVGPDTLSTVTTGAAVFGSGATASSNVGTYAIAGSGLVAAGNDYVFAQAAGNAGALTVTPAPLTVSGSKPYDATTGFGAARMSVAGAVNGETLTLVAGSGSAASANVATYAGSPLSGLTLAVVGGNALASNYMLPGSGTLSITPAPIIVTAASGSAIYGNVPVDPGLSATGLQGGQGSAVLNGLSSSFALAQTSNAGAYALAVQGQLTNANYQLMGTQGGSFTITPRPLVVTADNQLRAIDTANAPLLYTIGGLGLGLVNGDGLTGSPATIATRASPAGLYPITQGTLAATSNYSLRFTAGTLDVQAAPVTSATVISAAVLASTTSRALTQVLGELADGTSMPIVTSSDEAVLGPQVVRALSDPRYDSIVICDGSACTVIPTQKPIHTSSVEP